MKRIELEFEDKTLIGLYGRSFGINVFDKQVKNEAKDESKVILVFPRYIETVGSSFAQGLLSEDHERFGYEYVRHKYQIVSETKGFEKQFWRGFVNE